MIYFIADTHFDHENIIRYCKRPFKNKQEMNNKLIKNWNQMVRTEDIVYHLGDLALKITEDLKILLRGLNGKKFLIKGNHDTEKNSIYENLDFKILKNPPIVLPNEKIILSHVPLPDKIIPENYLNIHGHIHNNPLHFINTKTGEMEYPIKFYSEKLHICVSADVIDFKPISLDKILKRY